ncbi:TetR/AcrR family transcriptional regulator [Sulfitobacter donghicola]|uniref:Transcriptional regulator n=1 Tax=Sulfitobacter donghicola DSW-25 = KCTC 12864 = JCM 14565 TaxID=1300350 RepID=A0A073IJS3_9RHOB|nr:TetR/AcrR family transcriptional regulator [Sulfitobacter donghicola]KEJ89850.1 transcriptional regulator [Sulfitobacter donghicola DSW-25 = KCTC 12864 = JCM 14565]KIN67029.1 Transcriptional regulator [Sulfitobacter donghicola DSW-25 = KCTC 12864 = JCM 14565]
MNKALITRENLLTHARTLLWKHGYSNVSLRQIAAAAGVDVALISRYFGNKRGLFEATIEGAFDLPDVSSREALVELTVELFVNHPRDGQAVSVLNLMLMNAQDEEVGGLVREKQQEVMQSAVEKAIGDRTQAALFMAVILGISVVEKTLHLAAIGQYDTPEYEAQLRHMLNAALSYQL